MLQKYELLYLLCPYPMSLKWRIDFYMIKARFTYTSDMSFKILFFYQRLHQVFSMVIGFYICVSDLYAIVYFCSSNNKKIVPDFTIFVFKLIAKLIQ